MKAILVFFLVLYLVTTQNTRVYANEIETGYPAADEAEDGHSAETVPEPLGNTYIRPLNNPPPSPSYTAAAVILMDARTGLVLYEHNAHTPMYPASITKVMTALIVLDHINDLSERIEFSHRAVWSIPRNSSHIAMDEGETLTVYQALYGLMLESANEVSIALAEHTAGSVEAFVDLMNRRAASLEANNTNFVNPSGLPGYGHVTTAHDMALIMREAVRHPVFRDIISTNRFDIPPTERQPEVRQLLNTNRMIRPGPFHNESVVGGKTGWTHDAGNTLVTYADDGNRRLIVTVLRGEGTRTFVDTTALLDFGFDMPFEEITVFDAENYALTVPVYQDVDGELTELGLVSLRPERNLDFNLPANFDTTWLRYELSVPESLSPPVMLGDPVGTVAVYVQNVRVDNVWLRAQDAILEHRPYMESYSDYPVDYAYDPHYTLTGLYERVIVPFLDNEYILTLAIPLAISIFTLLIALIVLVTRRKRRMRRALHSRYARYPNYYRYR